MTTHRPSKAEIRRLVRQHNAPEPAAPAFPADIAAYVRSYEPRTVAPDTWDTLKPFVLDVLARYEPQPGKLEATKLRLGALVAYVGWAHERGYALDRQVLLDYELVEAFTDSAGLLATTAANYRSRLRGVVAKVHPAGTGTTASTTVPHQAVKPPYTPRETAAIERITRTQPNPTTGRQLCACVGLGLGGGLDSPDLRPLHRRYIHDEGSDGIRVEVPGRRARNVWILVEYEDLVRRGIDGLRPSELVVGTKQSRRNVAAGVFERAHILGDAPHFEQSRMRTTWLARLLVSQVPLPVIMQAAGLTSARTLTDLVPLLDVDTAGTAEMLRGER